MAQAKTKQGANRQYNDFCARRHEMKATPMNNGGPIKSDQVHGVSSEYDIIVMMLTRY